MPEKVQEDARNAFVKTLKAGDIVWLPPDLGNRDDFSSLDTRAVIIKRGGTLRMARLGAPEERISANVESWVLHPNSEVFPDKRAAIEYALKELRECIVGDTETADRAQKWLDENPGSPCQ